MGSTEGVIYTRVRILGQLECRSPLHVGDGTDLPFAERRGRNDPPGVYRAVCLDARGPYIPATTLRGHLRDRCAANPTLADRLFGRLEEAGKVRIFDAARMESRMGSSDGHKHPYWDPERATAVQHGIAIKPIAGTVDDHLLFRHEVVPAGTRFSLELEADGLDQGALAALLGLLASLDGGPGAAVGRGASRMQGRLAWTLDRVDCLTEDALAAWLDDAAPPLDKAFRTLKTIPAAVPPTPAPGYQVRIRLRPLSPLLVNEPGLVALKTDRDRPADADAEERHDPDLEFSRTPDGRAQIPAASLRGLLRGRSRRILVTIAAARSPGCDAGRVADALLGRLFGVTGKRSRLWTSDAIAERPCDPIDQTFVAIDRFTGGGERHKLYRASAARCGILAADIRLDTRLQGLEDWEKALLFLLARDALEGDLAVGWGKARGYGALEVELEHTGTAVGAWTTPQGQGLLERIDACFGRATAQSWIDALHREIGAAIATASQG